MTKNQEQTTNNQLGFLNLHKPFGLTSHDCVAKVRKLLQLKRVGHGGTLDPKATGVLPIAFGKATRLLSYMPEEKVYHAIVRFGVQTSTDDLEGEVIESASASHLSLEDIQPHLEAFVGKITQIPPAYSAIQQGGKRLYELARAGKDVDVPPRTVEVYDIEVLNWQSGDYPELEIKIACGSGTYIRAIARDLGDKVGTGGTLAQLIRTRSCAMDLAHSITLETLSEQLTQGTFTPLSPAIPLAHLPSITLPTGTAKRWCNGQQVPLEAHSEIPPFIQVYNPDQQFLGIGEPLPQKTPPLLAPKVVIA
ncbi:tRNA pseudouridine(55) synthase TruB [Spirulina sp. CS-785/01]|uniref:tRNA pseudouridine(55) synthase TruB n=1 Tax=Spirulina sp. CS-785/01 TaxID=3021716 RepID=UPI0023312D9C|nr:tRNA pseudouridine(55) synthase TruB [Spirulina sp. CS-785/01]MDB9313573.1 tRNA pseudouridine(55) synthase TruB [Spirulina sp. CS-785/01]